MYGRVNPYNYNFTNVFQKQYYCRSTAMAGRDIDEGDKVILPTRALEELARMQVDYPMLFEISCGATGLKTHCGVLEFSAEEGFCYMPYWIMQNLGIDENEIITVKNVSLPKAKYVKFQAQSVDFLEVSNPRALLEVALRKFTCLTVGDIISLKHGTKRFALKVNEVKPNGAASIIETDCEVDFDEPLGYQDSVYAKREREAKERAMSMDSTTSNSNNNGSLTARTLQKAKAEDESTSASNSSKFQPFTGSAKRIDGKLSTAEAQAKLSTNSTNSSPSISSSTAAGIAENKTPTTNLYQSKIGDKYSKKKAAVAAFGGVGHKLSG